MKCFLLFLLCTVVTGREVQTPKGRLLGISATSSNGVPFYQFLGIQFASVPGRFQLAVPSEPWEGLKNATEYGPRCDFEELEHGKNASEDCLYLNLFTPSLEKRSQLPVVVYIHGGSFNYNSNQGFGPNYFLNKQVILVVIQYRLKFMGFLSTGDEVVPGNNGLKDQVLALKWVQENIESFGGNKSAVTIMGQSAGSASVTYHLVSPMSRGLFKAAIAQSGTFLDPWAFTRHPRTYATRLAQQMNCTITTSKEMVDCLKTIPLETILNYCALRNVTVKWHADPLAAFGPVVEPDNGPEETTFLETSPYELLSDGHVTRVPLLTGIAREEGVYLWAHFINYINGSKRCNEEGTGTHPWLHDLQTKWFQTAPLAFYYDETVQPGSMNYVSRRIREYYFRDEEINHTNMYSLAHIYSDRLFVNSALKFIYMYSQHAPVYPYLYTFNKYWGIEFNFDDSIHYQRREATHAAELDMLFSPLFGTVRNTTVHNDLSQNMLNLWYSFIKYGEPTGTYGSATKFPKVNYPSDSPADLKWYQLDIDTALVSNEFKSRFEFWNNLPIDDTNFYQGDSANEGQATTCAP